MGWLRAKRVSWGTVGAVAVLLTVGAACGDDGQDDAARSSTTEVAAAPRDFSGRGPFAVGATRLEIDDRRPVAVFYPADLAAVPADATGYAYTPEEVWGPLLPALPSGVARTVEVPDAWVDVPAATGPFPVVVISHGLGMMRFSYAYHAAHLASWGYVVANPEHPTRDLHARLGGMATPASDVATILDTAALLDAESGRSGGVLEGRVDGDQVAVEGHSAGGRDAGLAAYDPAVDTWIGVAPSVPIPDSATGGRDVIADGEYGYDTAAGEFDLAAFLAEATPPDKPSMMVVADNDVIFPVAELRTVFDWLAPPKRYVVLADTGHSAFVNECRSIQEAGESRVARALGFGAESIERRLLEDGCLGDDAPVEEVWATWDHLTVAQLNWVFEIDLEVAAASLDADYLDATFPGRIAEYVVEP